MPGFGFANALLILAALVLVVIRQTKPQRMTGSKRWWLVPAVLAYAAVKDTGLVDTHHEAASTALLGCEVLVGLLMGVAWARTSHVWTEQDGSVWTRGTKATVGVWVVGIAARLGLMGAGLLIGIHQGTGALLLALAASLLVRAGLLELRARSLRPAPALAGGVR
ncbi:CcdC protein domain-containing protein [Streptomyces aureocirculatus]|uniref:CcdC protein domain-containing protein n=1 Tax=Streptomyces aureocirculatus TaxID=67275 RepID=UPI0004C8CBD3|nr:CcdC protein domain-containing protein [Streptomyces aureocirculatus]